MVAFYIYERGFYMRKRIVTILLALTMLLVLSMLPSAATTEPAVAAATVAEGTFHAGFSKICIDPSLEGLTGLPMSGYGNTSARLSEGYVDANRDGDNTNDGLYATCIAITDSKQKTVLVVSVDLINSSTEWTNGARQAIVDAATEAGITVDYDDVIITASHTHSGPDAAFDKDYSDAKIETLKNSEVAADQELYNTIMRARAYREFLYEQLSTLAVNALADRGEVTLSKGEIDASQAMASIHAADGVTDGDWDSRLNCVRHYKVTTYQRVNYTNIVSTVHIAGSNFGKMSLVRSYDKAVNGKVPNILTTNISNYYFVEETSEADDTMYLVKLTPTDGSKEPIVMVNWRAQNTMDSTTTSAWGLDNYNNISPDYVGTVRTELEKAGYRASFIQGAAGNMTGGIAVLSQKNSYCLEDVTLSDGTDSADQPTGYKYGLQLALVAKQGLSNNMGSNLDTSEIRTTTATFVADYNGIHDTEAALLETMTGLTADDGTDLISYLTYNDARWTERSSYVTKYAEQGVDISHLLNVQSRYHMNGIRARGRATDRIPSTNVAAIALGDQLSFVVAPFELADRYSDTYQTFADLNNLNNDNDWDDLYDATYGTPLVLGYANGANGYIPHALAYDYNNGVEGYDAGSYESSGTRYAAGSGEALLKMYDNMLDTVNPTATKEQCECGGTAVGKYGHTCQDITFLPWNDPDSLPNTGNYYLTTDVTIRQQHAITETLHLDLNGHNIVHKVAPLENMSAVDTRVFSLYKASADTDVIFSITDSTGCGTVSRDLSNLTSVQQNTITNWGLIILVANDSTATYPATGSFTLYNGILDATGQYSGGGSVISNGALDFTVTMYGGEMKGGICGNAATSTNSSVGAIYSVGHVNMFGGKLSGGLVYNGSNYAPGGIRITVTTGKARYLTLSGDAVLYGNYRTTDGENRLEANTQIRWGQLRVAGTFTGKASITYVDSYQKVNLDPANGTCIMNNDNLSGMDISQGQILVDNHPEMVGYLLNDKIYAGIYKDQCECGGKAVGKYNHTCETIRFLPWTTKNALPNSGNWYLTAAVTTTAQRSVTGDLRLDLNGYNITHKVAAAETGSTRVFHMSSTNAYLSITDSTSGTPGVISRDLSLKDTAAQEAIGNWGLICYMGGSVKGLTVYDGILDTTGQYSGGGSIFSNASTNAPLTIYGGELRGGITKGSWGAIHASAPVNLFGGTITGGKIVGGGNAYGGAVRLGDGTYKLTISGDVKTIGNSRVANASAAPTVSNIFVNPDQLVIVGTFTGEIGLAAVANNKFVTPSINMVVGECDNATITGTISMDNYQQYAVTASGTDLVLESAFAVQTDSGMNTYTYETLTQAIAEYPGNGAVMRLLQDSAENVTFDQETYLDLNGFDVAGVSVNEGVTLYVFDSETDDYTVEDGIGYGKLVSTSGDGTISALPSGTAISRDGYLMIKENDGTSFHRLNLNTVGLSLRASEVGVYYQSQFGGDEVIKRNIAAYGSALGAGQAPTFADKTYTRFEAATWQCGTDSNGNSKNLSNGTILTGIMQTKNTYSINKRNGGIQIYSQAYIELTDGTRVTGPCVQYSLQQIMEGAEGLIGVDPTWDTLTEEKQTPIIDMYNTFSSVVSKWNIPRIKATVTGDTGEDTPYEDDGILKVLLIGHSLGIDSAYFFPEVYKEETGKDIVVGMLYHSGCPLYNHVSYLTNNSKQYAYYEFDTSKDVIWRRAYADGTFHTVQPGVANDTLIADGTIAVTMQYGIKRADWDIVVMQAGVWEAAGKGTSSTNAVITRNIQTIRNYVINQDIEKRSTPEFAWNITWAPPSLESGLLNSSYTTNFTNYFDCDTEAMFGEIARVVTEAVAPADTWNYILPSGTALHNAKTVMDDTLLYRDTVHASDFGRLMFAYIWLCRFENMDIDDCDITSISGALRRLAADRGTDYALTDVEKANFKKFVRAALETPYAITDCSK